MPERPLVTFPPRRSILLVIALFAAIGFAIYGSSLQNGFVQFDDDTLITGNRAVHELTPRSILWAFSHFDPELYIPLTFLSYQADHAIAGLSPAMFHGTNLLLHIGNALLAAWLILLLSGKKTAGLLGGLLFLAHPLNTEAVAWASARKDVLSTFFFLLSVSAYLLYRRTEDRRYLFGSLGAFLLGLLAKVSILLLPVALLLIDWREGRRSWRKAIAEKLPFFALSGIFGAIALFGKQEVLADSPLGTSLLMAVKSTAFYLQKLILPTKLSVIYPYHEAVSLASPDFLIPLFLITLLATLVILSLRRTREVAFGASFFLLMLLPSFTNYAKAGDVFFASDRYAYVPAIGLFLLASVGVASFMERREAMVRSVAITAAAATLAALAFASFRQARAWESTEALFAHALEHYEDSHHAHYKLGGILLEQGSFDEAERHLLRSIEIKPTPHAFYNLGLLHLSREEFPEAVEANEHALTLDPRHVSARINLGYLLWRQGDLEGAEEQFQEAVRLATEDTDALANLAALLIQRGRGDEAALLLERILAIDPGNEDALRMRGKL